MRITILIIILVILFGCDDFTSEPRFSEDNYVITGLLHEGEPIQEIFIGKTIDPSGSITDFNIDYADVWIKEYDGSTLLDSVQLTYFPISDEIGVYIDPTQAKIITSGFTYRIEAEVVNEIISGETTVPSNIEIILDDAFTTDENLADYPDLVYEEADQQHPLLIKTDSGNAIHLMFEFYCLLDFEDEPQYINVFGNHTTPLDAEEYENPADGSPRSLDYYGEYLPVWKGEYDSFVVTEQSYSAPFVFYGDYQLTISSLSESYYNYLYHPEGYANGGITNGFGYFGAVSSVTLYTEVVE